MMVHRPSADKDERTSILERIGVGVAVAGGLALLAAAIATLANGSWPAALQPIQAVFAATSSWIGDWTLILAVWISIGPGLLIVSLGRRLRERRTRWR
jgi:hypothetical protein